MSCSADDPTMARRPRHPPPSYGCNRRPCPATVRNHRLHRRNPAVLMPYITILTKSNFPAATAAMPYRGRASGPAAWARCPIRPHICAGLSARGNASPTAPHDDPSRWQDMQRIALNDTGASMIPGQSGIKRKQVSGFRESASCALVREYESSSHKHHRERSPHYASCESSSRTESSSSGMTATVLTSVFSRYFSAKSNVVDTITTPFLTCEPLIWHRRSPLPPAPTIEARRRARHKTADI